MNKQGATKVRAKKSKDYTVPAGKVLVLRTCAGDLTGYGGFQWPSSGLIAAPDWKKTASCGNGLHGLLWGSGNVGYLNLDQSAKWLVVEVDANSIVEIDRKVKFPSGVVIFVGNRDEAVALVIKHAPPGTACVFGTATAGYGGTATAGECGAISILRWDGKAGCYRRKSSDVGENGILPKTKYRLNDKGEFEKAE